MKLYATTTSERASKGQGGNEFLDIVVTGEDGEKLLELSIKPTETGYMMDGYALHDISGRRAEKHISEEWEKGERQNGERSKD